MTDFTQLLDMNTEAETPNQGDGDCKFERYSYIIRV